jgi:hypothetical protein
MKNRTKILTPDDSPNMYLKTFETGSRNPKNHHITTFGKLALARAAHVYTLLFL